MSMLADIQTEVMRRLRMSAAVTALVPPSAIADGFTVPTRFPCIVVGEDQQIGDAPWVNDPSALISEVFVTLHVWTQSTGFLAAKNIVGAVSAALRGAFPIAGHDAPVCTHEDSRFLRDPDGKSQHAVVTFKVWPLTEEAA